MENLRILIDTCPEVVMLGAALCVLAGAFAVLAAYTLVCPREEEAGGDVI